MSGVLERAISDSQPKAGLSVGKVVGRGRKGEVKVRQKKESVCKVVDGSEGTDSRAWTIDKGCAVGYLRKEYVLCTCMYYRPG